MSEYLLIKPIEAELHRDNEKFQFLNRAFCVVKFGEKIQKTQINKGTVLKPFWTETITFEKAEDSFVKIELWNSIAEDQEFLVGETEIPVETIQANDYYSTWFDLKRDGFHVGQILVGTEFLLNTKKEEEPQEEVVDLDARDPEKHLKEADAMHEGVKEAGNKHQKGYKGANKLKEMFVSKRTEERAQKKRASLDEADLLNKDPHNPEFLKNKADTDQNDSEKLNPNLNLGFMKS